MISSIDARMICEEKKAQQNIIRHEKIDVSAYLFEEYRGAVRQITHRLEGFAEPGRARCLFFACMSWSCSSMERVNALYENDIRLLMVDVFVCSRHGCTNNLPLYYYSE
jgi:hypothetical protein